MLHLRSQVYEFHNSTLVKNWIGYTIVKSAHILYLKPNNSLCPLSLVGLNFTLLFSGTRSLSQSTPLSLLSTSRASLTLRPAGRSRALIQWPFSLLSATSTFNKSKCSPRERPIARKIKKGMVEDDRSPPEP